ncbi:MAG: hypothetical protein AAGF11_07810 [Myxococcota bacterium]
MSLTRRGFLRSTAAAATTLSLPGGLEIVPRAHAGGAGDPPRFLFVVAASGGANIVDGFWPVAQSEVSSAALADTLTVFPDAVIAQPAGSNLRCVTNLGITGLFTTDYDLNTFLTKYYQDMVVVPVENTSVNHAIAQKRAINGAGINRGRTLMEAMATVHDGGLLPNCNLATGGFIEPGDDESLPARARAELIADPLTFAVGTHGTRGLPGAPGEALVQRARAARAELEGASAHGQRYGHSALRQRLLDLQADTVPALEAADLITSLMIVPEELIDLAPFGLQPSPLLDELQAVFPRLLTDPLQMQAGLSFLLARYGVASAVTFGARFTPETSADGLEGTPLAFDFSHTDHVVAQNVMWGRMMNAVDGLITLLQGAPMGEGTMWDHSLVYVATDFGRTRQRPAGQGSFGTGHHLNNGALLVSPLLDGNRVWGGIDPDTLLTYGFDLRTGDPDPGILLREGHIYSLVCQAMGVSFDGQHDMSLLLA